MQKASFLLYLNFILTLNLFSQAAAKKSINTLFPFVTDSILLAGYKYKVEKVYLLEYSLNNKYSCSADEKNLINALKGICSHKEIQKIISDMASNSGEKFTDIPLMDKRIELLDSSTFYKYIFQRRNIPLFTITKPVFFNHKKFCIISYGEQSGGGRGIILKRKGKKWFIFEIICESYV